MYLTNLYELYFVYTTEKKVTKVREHFRCTEDDVLPRALWLQSVILNRAKAHGANIVGVSTLSVYEVKEIFNEGVF